MSSDSTISNLQQALGCAGKCDCCSSLQQQINEINSKLANLKSVDEEKIIDKSVNKAHLVLLPIFVLVMTQKITELLKPMQALLKVLAPLAPLVNILLTLGSVGASILALLASNRNFDALEHRIDVLENEDSKIYRLIQLNKYAIERADAKAEKANTALLTKIDAKLGAQIVGGISGSLGKFYEWAHIDRALNILTFAATVHNAMMLSNDIAGTLAQALSNVLTLIGIKDKDGNALNVSSLIGSTIENAIKGVIGAENYTQLSETFAKANRIYQATTNVLNSFLNLSQTILQASELIASYTSKIGNALKKGGVILENAYSWMNPQPKFNRVTQTLEALQNGASTIQMVTQAPLDIVNATTELTTASTEFVKAIKEDDKPGNKAVAVPEPDELKVKESDSRTHSLPFGFDFSDLFDGED